MFSTGMRFEGHPTRRPGGMPGPHSHGYRLLKKASTPNAKSRRHGLVPAFVAGTTGMYASPPCRIVLKLACFMPDCGLTIYSQQKNMGGNHDKSIQFACSSRRFR